MKATVFLYYRDDSSVYFEFDCDAPMQDARATLMMVCRGALMASMAVRVEAFDEEGFDICSYIK